jgi:hypothetical protein
LEREFEEVRQRFPNATIRAIAGQHLVSLGQAPLPAGWNKQTSNVYFFVPAGYPHANPDCFYLDPDVRLANGALPANAQIQQLADLGPALWFSYHVSRLWKPGRDRLLTWVATIAGRLAAAR